MLSHTPKYQVIVSYLADPARREHYGACYAAPCCFSLLQVSFESWVPIPQLRQTPKPCDSHMQCLNWPVILHVLCYKKVYHCSFTYLPHFLHGKEPSCAGGCFWGVGFLVFSGENCTRGLRLLCLGFFSVIDVIDVSWSWLLRIKVSVVWK